MGQLGGWSFAKLIPSLGIAFAVFQAGCSARSEGATNLLDREMANGRPVRSLWAQRAENDTVILGVYDPSDCLQCDGLTAEWIHWSRQGLRRAYLVILARPPLLDEARRIQLARLATAGVLSFRPLDQTTPLVYVVVGGHIVDSARGSSEERLLIGRIGHGNIHVDSIAR